MIGIFIWILFILPWIITIYCFIHEKIFSPMTKGKWIAILCSVVGGFVYLNYVESSGQWQPRLYQEELSNLTKQEGFLKHTTNREKYYTYYIEMKNGKKRPLEFVQLYTSRFKEYEEEFVTIWKKGRYVYQMEVEDNIVFLIDEANNEIFLFNCQGVLKNLMCIWVIVTSMFILLLYADSVSEKEK